MSGGRRQEPLESLLSRLLERDREELPFATVDHGRARRVGAPEVIYAGHKTPAQVTGIARRIVARSGHCLVTRAGADARAALVQAREQSRPLLEAERECLGFDHAELGDALLDAWSLPEAHREIVGRHHTPAAASRFPVEAAVTYMADIIANGLQLGTSGERLVPALEPAIWGALAIDTDLLAQLIADAEHQVGDMVAILAQE